MTLGELKKLKEDSYKYHTESDAIKAVEVNVYFLKYVPESLRTPELCLVAVKKNGSALRYVPEKLRTAELCLTAVEENIDALKYVPESLFAPKKLTLQQVNELLGFEIEII